MTQTECVENGGHCWRLSDIIGLSNPPVHYRECKHCRKQQKGIPQESINWKDV